LHSFPRLEATIYFLNFHSRNSNISSVQVWQVLSLLFKIND
jgi:hypothetical protein